MILLLPLLFGAVVVAPAVALDHQVIAASLSGADHLIAPDSDNLHESSDQAHDTPPLMAEAGYESVPPNWIAAWAPDRAAAAVRVLVLPPDEPPKRTA